MEVEVDSSSLHDDDVEEERSTPPSPAGSVECSFRCFLVFMYEEGKKLRRRQQVDGAYNTKHNNYLFYMICFYVWHIAHDSVICFLLLPSIFHNNGRERKKTEL